MPDFTLACNGEPKSLGDFMANVSIGEITSLVGLGLTRNELVVYIIVKSLTRYVPYTVATNETIATHANTTVRTVEKSIARLKRLGLVESVGATKRRQISCNPPSDRSQGHGENADPITVLPDGITVPVDGSITVPADGITVQLDGITVLPDGHEGVLKEYMKEERVKEYHEGGGAEGVPPPLTHTDTQQEAEVRRRNLMIRFPKLAEAMSRVESVPSWKSPGDDPVLASLKRHSGT